MPKVDDAVALVDIKCNPVKMHRLLLAFERETVQVWSINKDRSIASLCTKEMVIHNGVVLAAEWLNESEFIVGFAGGHLEVFQQGARKLTRLVQFEPEQGDARLYLSMRLNVRERCDGLY